MTRLLLLLVALLGTLIAPTHARPVKRLVRRPKVRTAQCATQHQTWGNGHAYSHDYRIAVMSMHDLGHGRNPVVALLQNRREYPCPRMIYSSEWWVDMWCHGGATILRFATFIA